MKTVLMAIAVVKDGDKLLIRRTDPAKNPYSEPWAMFGGLIDGEGTVQDLLNKELLERWSFTVEITDKLGWDEDVKADHDGEVKRFVYIDALCTITSGTPNPVNEHERLEWAAISDLSSYELNPPTKILLNKLGYLS